MALHFYTQNNAIYFLSPRTDALAAMAILIEIWLDINPTIKKKSRKKHQNYEKSLDMEDLYNSHCCQSIITWGQKIDGVVLSIEIQRHLLFVSTY